MPTLWQVAWNNPCARELPHTAFLVVLAEWRAEQKAIGGMHLDEVAKNAPLGVQHVAVDFEIRNLDGTSARGPDAPTPERSGTGLIGNLASGMSLHLPVGVRPETMHESTTASSGAEFGLGDF